MNYLIYIEHAAENLQFFLWYKDYQKRFTALSASEQALAPIWTPEPETNQPGNGQKHKISADTAAIFKGTGFAPPVASVVEVKGNPFNTPPRTPTKTPNADTQSISQSEFDWSDNGSTLNAGRQTGGSHQKVAANAFDSADVKYQPCKSRVPFIQLSRLLIDLVTIQPFREEIARIITIYIADGSPRQLNLSSKERSRLLQALASTTHPSALQAVVHTVEWSLRHQAHPNFIRWTICNGNRPRVIFARGLGIGGILGGIVAAVLITLSDAGRGWRVLAAIGFMIGIATLIAAWKGMCVVSSGDLLLGA